MNYFQFMDIYEIVERQREIYINDLVAFYRNQKEGARELLLAYNKPEEDEAFRLYRLDYYTQEGEAIELDSDKYLDFEPIECSLSDMQIQLRPFYWNGCEFILTSPPKDITWLTMWIKKRIDIDDVRQEDGSGLQGVIHNVTSPNLDSDCNFSVDFGSADTSVFWELVDEIFKAGIKNLRIGSFGMLDEETNFCLS